MAASPRDDALACLARGIEAVEPRRLVAEYLAGPGRLPDDDRPVSVVGIGKAAGAMARGAVDVLGERLREGILIVPAGLASTADGRQTTRADLSPPQQAETILDGRFEVHIGGHPIPSLDGVTGAAAVAALVGRAGTDDLLLHLISGGGSALMTLPPAGIELSDVQTTTDLLLRAGATIGELNCVRKHLDRLKGGRLARLAAPATSVALVLSDVIGDPFDVIASGPLSPDPTSFADARRILEQFKLWDRLPQAVREHLQDGLRSRVPDSPKVGDPCFSTVSNQIVGSNSIAADAVLVEARRRGYDARLLTTALTGEAREVGRHFAAQALRLRARQGAILPACLVAAGETTVTVRGSGRGGRNQELALGAALELDGSDGCLVASLGTDGIDGPTDAAGAIADGSTITRANAQGLSAEAALADNNAYPFFETLNDLIITGPTGTNVMDLQIALIRG